MLYKDYIEIRIKIGGNEIEIKGNKDDVKDFLSSYLPYIIKSFSREEISIEDLEKPTDESVVPPIKISKKEPVSRILIKLFSTPWAKKPKSLTEIMQALNNIGLYYQKSTVAVNLKRLVQRGELRRIKSKDGVYLYVPVKPPLGDDD